MDKSINKRNTPKENILQEVYEYTGVTYRTVREVYRKYGLTRQTFYNRYNAGWPIEELLEMPTVAERRRQTVTI